MGDDDFGIQNAKQESVQQSECGSMHADKEQNAAFEGGDKNS